MKTILLALILAPVLAFAQSGDELIAKPTSKYGKDQDKDVIGTIAKPGDEQKLPEELQKIPPSKSKSKKKPKK